MEGMRRSLTKTGLLSFKGIPSVELPEYRVKPIDAPSVEVEARDLTPYRVAARFFSSPEDSGHWVVINAFTLFRSSTAAAAMPSSPLPRAKISINEHKVDHLSPDITIVHPIARHAGGNVDNPAWCPPAHDSARHAAAPLPPLSQNISPSPKSPVALIDSAPGDSQYASMLSFFTIPMRTRIARLATTAAFSLAYVVYASIATALGVDFFAEMHAFMGEPDVLLVASADAPRLYVYSDKDEMVRAEVVEKHRVTARSTYSAPSFCREDSYKTASVPHVCLKTQHASLIQPMSLHEIQEPVAGIIQLVEYQRLETCLSISSAVVLVYDYMITCDLEASLIWSHHSGWSWTAILFLLNRYLPFAGSAHSLWRGFTSGLTLDACEHSFQVTGWLFLATITTAEIILTIRTWAVWQRKQRLTIVLSVVFAAVWGPNIAVMWIFLKSMEFGSIPYSGYQGCNIVKSSQIMAVTWALVMVYETIIFILMAYRGYIGYRNGGNSALFNVVYRDGKLMNVNIKRLRQS
ncbi:hypothetical protein EYR36_003329 [Pleurotus pulmonarius]|nr:hypothetical protein EYR36_003329 [Pleurotus pulmonarius]